MRWYLVRFLGNKCAATCSTDDPGLVNQLISEGWEPVHRKVYQYYLRGWNQGNSLVQMYISKKGIYHNAP